MFRPSVKCHFGYGHVTWLRSKVVPCIAVNLVSPLILQARAGHLIRRDLDYGMGCQSLIDPDPCFVRYAVLVQAEESYQDPVNMIAAR